MATVRPFAALRPPKNLAEKVSSLPYDVMSRDEAVAMARGNAHSFLHVCRADIDTSEALIHAPETYAKSRENLEKFIAEGTLVRDPKPCFYVYRQIFRGRAQTGVVGCASVDEYLDGIQKLRTDLDRTEAYLRGVRSRMAAGETACLKRASEGAALESAAVENSPAGKKEA